MMTHCGTRLIEIQHLPCGRCCLLSCESCVGGLFAGSALLQLAFQNQLCHLQRRGQLCDDVFKERLDLC